MAYFFDNKVIHFTEELRVPLGFKRDFYDDIKTYIKDQMGLDDSGNIGNDKNTLRGVERFFFLTDDFNAVLRKKGEQKDWAETIEYCLKRLCAEKGFEHLFYIHTATKELNVGYLLFSRKLLKHEVSYTPDAQGNGMIANHKDSNHRVIFEEIQDSILRLREFVKEVIRIMGEEEEHKRGQQLRDKDNKLKGKSFSEEFYRKLLRLLGTTGHRMEDIQRANTLIGAIEGCMLTIMHQYLFINYFANDLERADIFRIPMNAPQLVVQLKNKLKILLSGIMLYKQTIDSSQKFLVSKVLKGNIDDHTGFD